MPFTKHIIEPINISQCPLPAGEPNELECLSNLTLANVIRQLSSLGQHAGRIFEELKSEAHKISTRTHLMHQRIENLKSKCNLLDIQSEEVTLADLQTKKQYQSSVKIDQQVVSRKTMPDAMRIMYNNADPPPSLDKLNPYRTDGKDCMKFYTDPEFFFNIWCNELIKDNETRKIEKKRRKTKNDKQPTTVQQNNLIKSPLLINSAEQNGNSAALNQSKKLTNNYDETTYYQHQMLLINQSKGPQQIMQSMSGLPNALFNKHFQQQQRQNYEDLNNQLIIPIPSNILQQTNHLNGMNLNNYEIYSESNTILNGNKNGQRIIQNQQHQPHSNGKSNSNGHHSADRPMLPPPPVPNNQISDFQQIQQQMIKKKLTDVNISNKTNGNGHHGIQNYHHSDENNQQNGIELSNSADLPPPPSPPTVYGNNFGMNNSNHQQPHQNGNSNHNYLNQQQQKQLQHNFNLNMNQQMNKLNLNEKPSFQDPSEFDMPLPPPPIELQDEHDFQQNNHTNQQISPPLPQPIFSLNNNNMNGSLPPPPALPPLVESDTASSSSSISINNNSNQTKTNSLSANDEIKSARNCYLDDINKRRYQLKSTAQKDSNSLADESRLKDNTTNNNNNNNNNNSETIQPFVNNSDVAAIIDFIRKFRPHVRDSSDDDEENSDWDE